jgi:MFS family permease
MTSSMGFLRSNARWLSAGVLMTFLSCFGQTFFIAVFAGEIRAEFGLSHGAWGGIYAVGTLASAIVMVWAGVATDFFRARWLGAAVLVGLALSCLAMAFNPSTGFLILVVFLLRFFGQGMSTHIPMVAMTRWFVATRGRALAISGLGFAIGQALLPLFFVSLMALGIGWRALWILGAGIVALGIPILLVLLSEERSPKHHAQASNSFGMESRHWTRTQALRHPLFWFLVPSTLGPSAFVTAFFFHQVHFAEIKGWSQLEFVSWFPIYTALSVGAMLAAGWTLDKWGSARMMPFMQVPLALGFLVFAISDSPQMAFFGFLFMAMTTGANATLPPAFWAEFYGTGHIGSLKAMATAIMVLGSAIGPGLTGWLIDRGVGLEHQFAAITGYFVLASLLVWVGVRRSVPSLTPI